jgi:hypothetical protein
VGLVVVVVLEGGVVLEEEAEVFKVFLEVRFILVKKIVAFCLLYKSVWILWFGFGCGMSNNYISYSSCSYDI